MRKEQKGASRNFASPRTLEGTKALDGGFIFNVALRYCCHNAAVIYSLFFIKESAYERMRSGRLAAEINSGYDFLDGKLYF